MPIKKTELTKPNQNYIKRIELNKTESNRNNMVLCSVHTVDEPKNPKK